MIEYPELEPLKLKKTTAQQRGIQYDEKGKIIYDRGNVIVDKKK